VGNGMSSSFWNDRWRGEKCFRLKYPRLYSVSNQKEALVGGNEGPLASWYGVEVYLEKTSFHVGGGVTYKPQGGFGRNGVVGGGGWVEVEFGRVRIFYGKIGV